MKKVFQIVALVSFLVSCNKGIEPLYQWHFENNQNEKSISEYRTQKRYSIKSNFEVPEFVNGVTGSAIRFDGYSTSVEGQLPEITNLPISVSSWVALETYPTADAGVVTLISKEGKKWISVSIDNFGFPLLKHNIDGDEKSLKSENTISKFKWYNLGLSLNNSTISLFINGELVVSEDVEMIEKVEFQDIIIGKGNRDEKLHDLFPVSHINGIIDEIEVWNNEVDFNNIYKNNQSDVCPDLSIPKSRFITDFNRPKYHILPAANWTNESHGLIYHNDKYHIFNQKNGTNLFLGQINWGHFSSTDLVKWTEHKPVLSPEIGYDQIGIWSGHAIKDDSGKPVIFYTGGDGNEFGMCLAYPEDKDLIKWKKFEKNPVVQGPPKQYKRKDFRDPYVWKENDIWYMMVGFGIVEEGIEKGALLLYKSKDLKNWEYLHPLYKSEQDVYDTGVFWEMSVLWKMGDKYVLIVNPIPYKGKPAVALYWVGDFVNECFVPDNKVPEKLEVINRLLSPSVSLDKDGNTVAIAIIPDLIHPKLQLKQGWTHVLSVPRVWNLREGKLYQTPHPSLKKLRDSLKIFEPQKLDSSKNLKIDKGHQLEIIAEINTKTSDKFGFLIGKNDENGERTKLYFDLKANQLVINQTQSSKKELVEERIEEGSFILNKNEKIKIHLFIDGSVIEGFINDKDAFTTRIFPEFVDSNQIEIFVEGNGDIFVESLKSWSLSSSENQTDFCDNS